MSHYSFSDEAIADLEDLFSLFSKQ
ncbi:hypothetical protein L8106_05021 [Lyngbya sp. PCC 8106]|nr:hypothetical protein L8106_05021 [Lyngbya sp. PCC 8106]